MSSASSRPILVTGALPYANGSIHLGHLVEYIQADIFVRFLRMSGRDVAYLCADDTHGTPIRPASRQAGVSPHQLIAHYSEEHQRDFKDFGVAFDYYYTTHSEENRRLSLGIFEKLRSQGHIVEREVSQLYCPTDAMFLPDRFVRGTCPRCSAPDQYGDGCEACGTHYEPDLLAHPRCATCGVTPDRRTSVHHFFRLSDFGDRLTQWVEDPGHLQVETRRWSQGWLRDGLRDWDVTRDAPYFGFEVPGVPGKYLYVWLDAPIGYIATTERYCAETGRSFDGYWRTEFSELYHFIGKDITYFHTLFWPAVLAGAGYRLPTRVCVHGFLTVNGEKMSKSRGTFITARRYLDLLNPEYLRFYYATKLSGRADYSHLNLDDFAARVNADLVNNIVNLASRTAPLLARLGGTLDSLSADDAARFGQLAGALDGVAADYEARDYHKVVRFAVTAADVANQVLQARAPWALKGADPDAARVTCTFALQVFKLVITVLKPVLPVTAAKAEEFLRLGPLSWDDAGRLLPAGHRLREFTRLAERLAPEQARTVACAGRGMYWYSRLLSAVDWPLGCESAARAGRIARIDRCPHSTSRFAQQHWWAPMESCRADVETRGGLSPDDLRQLREISRDEAAYRANVALRRTGVPVEYPRGSVVVGGHEFKIDRRAYVPNTQTEHLLREALQRLRPGASVLEVGTGCGWLAISMKFARPDLTVAATDIDPGALELAAENAARLGVQVRFAQASYVDDFEIVEPAVIVADLPYGEEADVLHEGGLAALRHMPPISTFHPKGATASYVELLQSVSDRGWKPIVLMETGRLERSRLVEAFPGDVYWEHLTFPRYSVAVLHLGRLA